MTDRKDYMSSCKITLKTDRQDHRVGNSGLKGPPEVSSLISLQAGSATRSAWLLRSLSGLVLKTFKAGECRNSLSIYFKVLGCPHNEEVFISSLNLSFQLICCHSSSHQCTTMEVCLCLLSSGLSDTKSSPHPYQVPTAPPHFNAPVSWSSWSPFTEELRPVGQCLVFRSEN